MACPRPGWSQPPGEPQNGGEWMQGDIAPETRTKGQAQVWGLDSQIRMLLPDAEPSDAE